MKRTLEVVLLLIFSFSTVYANKETDSLLTVLDKIVADRHKYTDAKRKVISELKQKKIEQDSLVELYHLNSELIQQYETFICDSAEYYIHENIALAKQMGDEGYWQENRIKLALVYSLSGLFFQASEIFDSIPFQRLPDHLKVIYCWNKIKFYENLIRYTDDIRFSEPYIIGKEACRDTVMNILYEKSDMYLKEKAIKLEDKGMAKEALPILLEIYKKEQPGTHSYAMMAMGLAKAYRLSGDTQAEDKYLILSAMTDIQLAVKENEALLSLAVKLYHAGDIERAYNYIKVALEDAVFYNSRFKNTIISRIHPIIENTYLYRLKQQKRNLRIYILLIGLFAIALSVTLYFTYKQTKMISKAKRNLKAMNDKLIMLNHNLDEANLVKERYVAYFMNQCGVYISKLEEYRKNVNRKIKSGKVDELLQSSARPFERELEDLYVNFDKAFLKLYPNFVEEFNAFIKPEERFYPKEERLNTELRIFALMRLGITDVAQIAVFLHYTPQTIYNYKNKVKGKSVLDADRFEEEVRNLGSFCSF